MEMEEKKAKAKKPRCSFCDKTFYSLANLQRHTKLTKSCKRNNQKTSNFKKPPLAQSKLKTTNKNRNRKKVTFDFLEEEEEAEQEQSDRARIFTPGIPTKWKNKLFEPIDSNEQAGRPTIDVLKTVFAGFVLELEKTRIYEKLYSDLLASPYFSEVEKKKYTLDLIEGSRLANQKVSDLLEKGEYRIVASSGTPAKKLTNCASLVEAIQNYRVSFDVLVMPIKTQSTNPNWKKGLCEKKEATEKDCDAPCTVQRTGRFKLKKKCSLDPKLQSEA